MFSNIGISGWLYHLSWPYPLEFSLHLLNPYCFFVSTKAFILLYPQMISWFYFHCKCAGRNTQSFLCSLLVHLGQKINLQSLTFASLTVFVLGVVLGYSGYVCISAIWWSPRKQQLALSLLQTKTFMVIWVMSFWARTIFVPTDMHNLAKCAMPFRVIYRISIILLLHYFVPLTFPFQLCINIQRLFPLQQS